LAVEWIIYVTRPPYDGVVCGAKPRRFLYPMQPFACDRRVNAMKFFQMVEGVLRSILASKRMTGYVVSSIASATGAAASCATGNLAEA